MPRCTCTFVTCAAIRPTPGDAPTRYAATATRLTKERARRRSTCSDHALARSSCSRGEPSEGKWEGCIGFAPCHARRRGGTCNAAASGMEPKSPWPRTPRGEPRRLARRFKYGAASHVFWAYCRTTPDPRGDHRRAGRSVEVTSKSHLRDAQNGARAQDGMWPCHGEPSGWGCASGSLLHLPTPPTRSQRSIVAQKRPRSKCESASSDSLRAEIARARENENMM